MSPRGRQLVLELAPQPAFEEEDFLLSPPNEEAFAALAGWPDWPDPTLVLVGPPGAGKSHLAAIWRRRADALALPSGGLRADGLAALGDRPILLEDADRVADEAALFHLLNLVRERETSLLLTARRAPERWGLRLPDLLSRLRRAPRVEIASPDDGLVRAVLVKLLVERQLLVDEGVIEFVSRRIERSLDTVRDFVTRLDLEALSTGRRISRPLASDVLKRLEEDMPEKAP